MTNILDFTKPLKNLKQSRLVGVNVTDGACFPGDPVQFATFAASRWNCVRFHHIDVILRSDWSQFPKLYNAISECVKRGIACSLDGMSKWGEGTDLGIDRTKLDLIRGDAALRADYQAYVTKLLTTKGPDGGVLADKLWMICLVNEAAHLLQPDDVTPPVSQGRNPSNFSVKDAAPKAPIEEFHDWARGVLASCGFKGKIGDMPDGLIKGEYGKFAMDLSLVHFYGDDARDLWRNGYWATLWAPQGWQWGGAIYYSDVAKKDMTFVEEWGSPLNPNRGANSFFFAGEMQRLGWSSCAFAWASNPESWAGNSKTLDPTNIVTDEPRIVVDRLLGALYCFDARQNVKSVYGHLSGAESDKYSYQSDTALVQVTGSTAYAIVAVKGTLAAPKKLLVFTAAPGSNQGFDSQPIDPSNPLLRQIVTPGSTLPLRGDGFKVSIPGGRVTSAFQLDVNGSRVATLPKDEHGVTPIYGTGIVEVNCK